MENTTGVDFEGIITMKCWKTSIQTQAWVNKDDAIESMKEAVRQAIPIIVKECANQIVIDGNPRVAKKKILDQSEPLKKMLGI